MNRLAVIVSTFAGFIATARVLLLLTGHQSLTVSLAGKIARALGL